MTVVFTYWNFHILVTIWTNQTRMTITKTDFEKWEFSDQFIDTYAKFNNLSEHLSVDEVTVPFKGRVIFKHCMPKKHKCFSIKIYKLCSTKVCIFNVKNYLGKDRQNASQTVTVTHVFIKSLTRRIYSFVPLYKILIFCFKLINFYFRYSLFLFLMVLLVSRLTLFRLSLFVWHGIALM
jgi:hypothetical protein